MAQEGKPDSAESSPGGATDDPYLQAVQSAPQVSEPPPMPGIPERSVPKTGEVLAGKYRVERVLGAGGMGVVVEAYHLHLDTRFALKFMTEETFTDRDLVARFLREARATARLRGEHVVRVSDVGELDSGAPFMVMEYLQGQDLSALLTSLGPPPLASAVEYAIQTCDGLEEAHRAGFVHRDVKPSNLFLTRRPNGTPCIKIVDFGISKAVTSRGADPLHSTSTRAIFGSPLYMAPEQMRAARDVDARADLWSLGAALYELLSGTVPFAAESLVDLAYRIANEDPPSLRSRGAEIPPRLEQIVLRCLEKDRNRRFPDARSLALALEEFRTPQAWESTSDLTEDDKTTVMDPLAPEPARSEAAGELSQSLSSSSVSWGRSQRLGRSRTRPRRALLYVAALVLGGTIATLAALFTRQEDAPPASAPTAMSPPTVARALSAAAPEAPAPSTEPPTVSVTDLPVVSAAPVLPAMAVPQPAGPVAPKAADVLPLRAPEAPTTAKAVVPAPVHSAATGCSPPYSFDELGRKIFKPECVN